MAAKASSKASKSVSRRPAPTKAPSGRMVTRSKVMSNGKPRPKKRG